MRFLLDANLPRSLGDVARGAGYECAHVRDVDLAAATDVQIARHARSEGLALLTRDVDFGDVRNYPPEEFPGIVVFRLPETATAQVIHDLAKQFFARSDLIQALPGRLAIVEFGRVRLRPPATRS